MLVLTADCRVLTALGTLAKSVFAYIHLLPVPSIIIHLLAILRELVLVPYRVGLLVFYS